MSNLNDSTSDDKYNFIFCLEKEKEEFSLFLIALMMKAIVVAGITFDGILFYNKIKFYSM